jgi:hypothetical protein
MLAVDEDGLVPSGPVAAQVREATQRVIAEVEALSRAVLDGSPRETGADTFLSVRVTRLSLAADRAVAAATSGDLPALRAELRHFETLTTAIWMVEDAVYGSEPDFSGISRPAAVR